MHRTSDRSALLIFAKAPVAGHVKTRLAPVLGPQRAATLHARLLERTLVLASRAAVGATELYADPASDAFMRACASRHAMRLTQQRGNDLGMRMHQAFVNAFERGCSNAILIGTDCPGLGTRHLRLAIRVLDDGKDAVLVPAEDGGYALIGLRCAQRHLFKEISWGTDNVMGDTRRRMKAAGLTWTELETLWDVDRPEDYERLASCVPARQRKTNDPRFSVQNRAVIVSPSDGGKISCVFKDLREK
jgi:uncharacterized protein